MSSNSGKVPALKLTLGGAPIEWHLVGTDAYVHPTIASPVGGEGECSLERARELDKLDGAKVKLVHITEKYAEECRKKREEARTAGISAARESRSKGKQATAEEAARVTDEAATAAGKRKE
jgi:hypothetical protein